MTRRRLAIGALIAGLAAVAIAAGVVVAESGRYVLRAKLKNANGLVKGFSVRINGAQIGKVTDLTLTPDDHVLTEMKIDKNALPLGRDATVTVRTLDLFGEKFVDLDPGNRRDPAPSGMTIPPERTSVATEMDDVINTLNRSTRDALAVWLDEQGAGLVGRGHDLGALLRALPPSLDRTGQLVAGLAQDNRALGRLIEESDRVVGSVARERAPLGRLVDNAATTLDTLGTRNRELGQTVDRAPATLVSARRALAKLQGAAIPLGPAARGLRATAPELTSTLKELPGFAASARPTLRTVRDVAPTLGTLGRRGTPIVRRLQPLTGRLSRFADVFSPSARIFSEGWPEQLALMEGWARATQVRDAASQIFRFGAAGVDDPSAFRAFLDRLAAGDTGARPPTPPAPSLSSRARKAARGGAAGVLPPIPGRAAPGPRLPAPPHATGPRAPSPPPVDRARPDRFLLDYLLQP